MANDASADHGRESAQEGYCGGGATRRWGWQRSTWGEAGAEFLGTFVLIMFGDGVVATCVAGSANRAGRDSPSAPPTGS